MIIVNKTAAIVTTLMIVFALGLAMIATLLPPMASANAQVIELTPATRNGTQLGTAIRFLPFEITDCGRYYLTRCLEGEAGSHGITILSDDVTLDLNGFSIRGVPGSRDGILASGKNIRILNGNVRDWGGGIGIHAQSTRDCRVEDVNVSNSGSHGIHVGDDAIVTRCISSNNGDIGVFSASGSNFSGTIVSHCLIRDNVSHAIRGQRLLIHNNIIKNDTMAAGSSVFFNNLIE